MTPVAVIETLLKVNKPAAGFILAGLAVIAASAIAVTFIGGNQNAMTLGFYIIGFAVLVTVLTFVVSNERMRAVLGWILVAFFALFMVGLVDAAAQISGRMPAPVCYLKMLTEDPKVCVKNLTNKIAVTGPIQSTTAGVQPTTTPKVPNSGPIFLHYSREVAPADMVILAQTLSDAGWPVENPKAGGVLVKGAPTTNQIRYYDDTSRRAAITLAAQISTVLGRQKVEVRDFSKSGLIAKPGLLEIWIVR